MAFKPTKKYNPYLDPATDNMPISDEAQKVVNTPVEKPNGLGQDDLSLAEMIVKLVDEGKINLYRPSSLLNQDVYDKLDDAKKAKIDKMSFNMLTTVRDIYNFYKSPYSNNSYQFENMLQKFRILKEETEKECGDVYVL
ncbi:MAG: hypothetical protein ACD_51C00028G0002 [uncultured bacterium]|nr:MAG: hypothetical protein ACD_51C00028G0002 [uncultured bacterium]OGJ47867.1 MAG: hypothetical protein A2244_05305 [Candidatus Peregrinibacteria bacterium RIFOXYA2_FULL_41_18]OGJ48910.1 MAG: hypothetical protein A2344_02745 [Candidatus Peregrinibacteria bacterium RIFOXYB12_FULL_41_12]OGJ52872.1 MAG: hypothetical protein A2448_02015 [Candidatus Peregrinibacteria bacterium RIFOXYC2_FULL_41_22]